MRSAEEIRAQIARLQRRVADARQRAAYAGAAASRLEEQAPRASASSAQACLRLAALQRRVQARQLVSARLQDHHADRLRGWLELPEEKERRPGFIDEVAVAIGMPSAAVVLLGTQRDETVLTASDATARAAHDLEFVLGEGPAQLAVAQGQTVQVTGTALADRWPQYGPAVGGIGVQAVIAVPLHPPAGLGAVCGYGSHPAISARTAIAAGAVADALPLALAEAAAGSRPGDGVPASLLFSEADFPAMVHQAAGMMSAYGNCGISDALALLRARAFSTGRPAEEIAAAVVRGELRLC